MARTEWDTFQKLEKDPRITPIGQLIRKMSLDELPQFWNVLKGDMSLVGPRPCMERQKSLYGKNWEHYCAMRPGITGLWQVSGRNRLPYAKRVELDATTSATGRCGSTSRSCSRRCVPSSPETVRDEFDSTGRAVRRQRDPAVALVAQGASQAVRAAHRQQEPASADARAAAHDQPGSHLRCRGRASLPGAGSHRSGGGARPATAGAGGPQHGGGYGSGHAAERPRTADVVRACRPPHSRCRPLRRHHRQGRAGCTGGLHRHLRHRADVSQHGLRLYPPGR